MDDEKKTILFYTFIFLFLLGIGILIKYSFYEYNKTLDKALPYLSDRQKLIESVEYVYSCDLHHYNGLCNNQSFQNITGHYCNGYLVCANTIKGD